MSSDPEKPAQPAVHTQSMVPQEGLSVPSLPSVDDSEKDQMAKVEEDSSPVPGAGERQGWNNPKVNMWRFMATIFCFLVLGANDAAVGVCKLTIHSKSNKLTFCRHYFHMYDR